MALAVLGIAGVLAVATPAQADAATECTLVTRQAERGTVMVDPIGGPTKFHRDNGSAFIKVIVDGPKNCSKTVSLAAWRAPNATFKPWNEQVLESSKTRTLTPGEYLMQIEIPKCYFQIDLVHGSDPTGFGGGGAYQEGRMINSVKGGDKLCTTPTPPPTPVVEHNYSCTALTVAPAADRKVLITSFAVATQNATFTHAVINWGDGTTESSANLPSMTHQYGAYGDYSVSATAYFNITDNGVTREVSAPLCSAPITFTQPPVNNIYVCDLKTKKIVTVDEANYDHNRYTTDLAKCAEVTLQVCDLNSKQIVSINENEFDSAKYTKDLEQCATTTVVTPPAVKGATLVNTGPGSMAALAGVISVAAAAAHAFWQRRTI